MTRIVQAGEALAAGAKLGLGRVAALAWWGAANAASGLDAHELPGERLPSVGADDKPLGEELRNALFRCPGPGADLRLQLRGQDVSERRQVTQADLELDAYAVFLDEDLGDRIRRHGTRDHQSIRVRWTIGKR